MEKNHIIALLPEFLDKSLDEIQTQKVAIHLAQCAICSKELEELKVLLNAFNQEQLIEPSNALRTNFFTEIELEKQQDARVIAIASSSVKRKRSLTNNFLKIAASIALLFGSFILGKQQQQQVSSKEIAQLSDETIAIKQTAMLSLMGNKSASKRIQGVNFIEEFSEPDEAIVSALADRMLNDENTNVRRTAVEVLSEFTTSETVKNSFLSALKIEKDPGIQITIIQVLGQMQIKKALAPMQFLLNQEDTQPYVKDELKSVIPTII